MTAADGSRVSAVANGVTRHQNGSSESASDSSTYAAEEFHADARSQSPLRASVRRLMHYRELSFGRRCHYGERAAARGCHAPPSALLGDGRGLSRCR